MQSGINPVVEQQTQANQKNDFKFIRQLGKGGFSSVYLFSWNAKQVAVKVFNKDQEDLQTSFDNEKKILDKLTKAPQKFVIHYYGQGKLDEGSHCMVLEYMPNGDLQTLLSKYTLVEKQQLKFANQIAVSLNYIHGFGIIHRDLKASNLLLDEHYNIKLCDFGLSAFLKDEEKLKEPVGSPDHAGPEILNPLPKGSIYSYSYAIDVYAFSIVLYVMIHNHNPYPALVGHDAIIMDLVLGGGRPEIDDKICQPGFAKLMMNCWEQNPKKRPTTQEIIKTLDKAEAGFMKLFQPTTNDATQEARSQHRPTR